MEKEIIVTPDGRTIVDANKLFKDQEVIEFINSIRDIHHERGGSGRRNWRRGPRLGRVARNRDPLK